MAIRITSYQVCDRCQKPYAEEHLEYLERIPEYKRKALRLTDADKEIFSFQDLCDDCDRVVDGLIKKIKLESEPKKTKAETVESKPDPSTSPTETQSNF